jgi:hypothetical protein
LRKVGGAEWEYFWIWYGLIYVWTAEIGPMGAEQAVRSFATRISVWKNPEELRALELKNI